MVPFDIGIPEERVGLAQHRSDLQTTQVDTRHRVGRQNRLFDMRIGPVRDRFGISRRGQRDEPVDLHAIERDPATHILQAAVVAPPSEPLTDLPRQARAVHLRNVEQFADQLDLGRREVPSAIARHSVRLDQAGRLQRVQHLDRLVAARLIDRRGRRLGQLFRGFQQSTVQAFVRLRALPR